MRRKYFMAALSLVVTTGLAAPSLAQSSDASTQSAEELQQIFEQQKTRGLVIAPSGSTQAATETTSEDMAKATVYTPVDAGTEINVRVSFDFDSALLRQDQPRADAGHE